MEGVLKEESSNVLPSIHKSEAQLREVFKLVSGKDRTWGLEFYEVNKVYEDPVKIKEERLRMSGSPGKKVYVTKKGHYLDSMLRMNKIPGPGTYKMPNAWADGSQAKKRMTSERKTYLDWIFCVEKKNKYPAPNVYNVVETEEDKKVRLAKMSKKASTSCTKLNFIDTCQYASLSSPGPGNYNPREIQTKIKDNPHGPDFIRKYHLDQEKSQLKRASSSPSMTKYNPSPLEYHTFSRMTLFPKHYSQKKNGWGTEEKLKIQKKGKENKENQGVPGPGHYNTLVNWKSKNKNDPKNNYFNHISQGHKPSVYN